MKHRALLRVSLAFLGLLLVSGCATLPDEAVTLSQSVGNDIQELHAGYRASVQAQFEHMRQAGLAVIDNRWTPIYLSGFVEDGQLVRFAQAGNTAAVEYWARTAIRRIDAERRKVVDPLNQREQALLAQVDEAFSRTISANATVTGLIESAIRVKRLQDDALRAAGVLEIRDQINNGVAEASNFVAGVTKEIEDAATALEKSNSEP
jgi:hypothetical protein